LAQRASAGIKVRQPLATAEVSLPFNIADTEKKELYDIIAEELNVKQVSGTVSTNPSIKLDLRLSDELRREGMMREVVRHVQNARKQARLNVDDRIALSLYTEASELGAAMEQYRQQIADETLAATLDLSQKAYAFSSTVKVEGLELVIGLQKA
jgi:isoleucyl-tRNA synthetase